MSFLSNSTWWLLFAGCNLLMTVLAIREAFRFRLMNGSYGRSTTFLAFFALPAWFLLLILMIVLTGWVSALVGLVCTFIVGQIVLRVARARFAGGFGMGEMFAQGEFERKLAKTSMENASVNEGVREVMQKRSLVSEDIEDVYERLRAVGLEHKQAAAAIRNPKIIEWYFSNISSEGKLTLDLSIEFKSFAMRELNGTSRGAA